MRAVGRWAVFWWTYAWDLLQHFARTLITIGQIEGRQVVRRTGFYQIYFTGVEAMPMMAGLALMMGAVIIAQSGSFLSGTGSEDLLGNLLQIVIFRELGPLMAALIVAGRSGSAITVELGNMAVHRELELLESMGIDPYRFLVLPRLVGVVAATFALCQLFDAVALMGGFAVARVFIDVPLPNFIALVATHLTLADLMLGVLKTVLFGAAIATVSTWHGLRVGRAITEVPQATRRSVVHSLMLCFALDAVLSVAFYAGGQG